MKDKNINDEINESSKISLATNRNHSHNDDNTTSDVNNNTLIFGSSIPNGINIRYLKTRRGTANCKCRFFGGAT